VLERGDESNVIQASAQLVPIPPPGNQLPSQVTKSNNSGITNDSSYTAAPRIVFLTNSLIEGKNVVKIKISDNYHLIYAGLKYVRNGQVTTIGLIRDPGDVYKALIDAHSPSTVIEAFAADANGKKGSVVKDFDVDPLSYRIFKQISHLFYETGKILTSTFAQPTGR
jgi:hypothetical protein